MTADYPDPGSPPGRITNPRTRFNPVGGRPQKQRRPRATAAHRARSTRGQHARTPVGAGHRASSAHGAGGHRFTVTAAQKATFSYLGQPGDPLVAGILAPIDTFHGVWIAGGLLGYVAGNPPLGFDNPAPTTTHLGHHPLADGAAQNPSSRFHPQLSSGTIVSFDSGSALAVMRLGSTPDSPIISVPLVGGLDPALAVPAALGIMLQPNPIDHTQGAIAAIR